MDRFLDTRELPVCFEHRKREKAKRKGKKHRAKRKKQRLVVLGDPKTGQALEVLLPSGRPVFARLLDEPGRPRSPGEQMADAVLVAERLDGIPAVRFVEFKGSIDEDDPDRPFDQVRAAADHLSDAGEGSHGTEHHDRWRAGIDLPTPDGGQLRYSGDHDVEGVIVTARGGTRHPPRKVEVAGRILIVRVEQRHGRGGVAEIRLDELLDASASGR